MSAPQHSASADKREEFRLYLERTRVTAVLTETLTDLFEMEARPAEPLRFLQQRLAARVAAAGSGPGAAGVSRDVPEKVQS